ncbi:transglutaminase-like putative cysteine protease [Hoeflea marina]|uniref:Transglutaminase-like putative cysteine protease n=1 Tax=Hoeflea marina TaxID=274592 RepID=A0A317PN23_9HYPH|nr:transglutaminase family protein [Hoeflea marina]PWW01659.1 transglutaminase-like putative cysteine protease [Hoeflea marina]
MKIRFGFEITVNCPEPVPMLLALSVHPSFAGRLIGSDYVRSSSSNPTSEYNDQFGNRITRTVAPYGSTTFWSDCVAEVDGIPDQPATYAVQHRIEDLPSETLNFLTASRYCDSDSLSNFAWQQFAQVPEGWPRVQAISTFVHNHVTFGYKFGRPDKTAVDVLGEKTGVCRDFAHLGVSLCRAMNIPARYCSGYLGDIGVPDTGFDDFCAWFEVYLGGQWHTVDARYNKPRIGRILMVRGTDASDVAMITSFGAYQLTGFRVWTTLQEDGVSDDQLLQELNVLPLFRGKVIDDYKPGL